MPWFALRSPTVKLFLAGFATTILIAAVALGIYVAVDSGGPGPSSREVAEMTAAASQAAGRPVTLHSVKVVSTDAGSWASAVDPVPAADLHAFFHQVSGVWLELGNSSGCLTKSKLRMPAAVEKALGACSVPG